MPRSNKKFSHPIVLIFYNRNDHIQEIFSVLQKIKPAKLYLVADGSKNKQEQLETKKVRQQVESLITWPTKLTKIYASKNMGLRNRVVSGLNRVFQKEKTAVILEDDCIPDITFFKFTDQLLKKYESNTQIGSITGSNLLFNKIKLSKSYYFSKYPHSWGWATWRRAWKLYDNDLKNWKNTWAQQKYSSIVAKWYWYFVFKAVTQLKIDSWAYRWTYSCWKNKLLTIIPKYNLVQNKGVGGKATNTKFKSKIFEILTKPLEDSLKHPTQVKINYHNDCLTEKSLYLKPRIIIGLAWKLVK